VYKRRTATADVQLGDELVRAGDKVTMWEMSANRDEAVFDQPFRFDAGRDPNPHVGFGHGAHYCLGANLARLEIRIVLEELLGAVGAIEPAGEPEWTRSNRLFGLRHLPVRFA
jgi:cytochrome P450